MPQSTLKDRKVALITGATHGIGSALSKKLLDNGWTVFGVGRDAKRLDSMSLAFPFFIPICADLTSNESIRSIEAIVQSSKLPLHLVVQNAGMKTPPRNLEDHSCEAVDEVISVNLAAPMKLTALLTRYMPAESRILYITSRAATLKLRQSSTYCATKAGLDEVAAIVRQELSEKNIGVSCVIPGEVDTKIQKILREAPMFHLNRMFQHAYASGKLISPDVCSDFLKWFACDLAFDEYRNSRMPVSIYDSSHHKHWLKFPEKFPAFPFDEPTQEEIRAKL